MTEQPGGRVQAQGQRAKMGYLHQVGHVDSDVVNVDVIELLRMFVEDRRPIRAIRL